MAVSMNTQPPTKSRSKRRATILLMVVGLLAMLFVIVTAYLTLARFDRDTLRQVENRRVVEEVVDSVNDLTLALLRESLTDSRGEVLTGLDPRDYSYESIPGYGQNFVVGALEPVNAADEAPGPPVAPSLDDPLDNTWYTRLGTYVWPAVSRLELGDRRPTRKWLKELIINRAQVGSEDAYDLSEADLRENFREPMVDADGDGVPDSDIVATRVATEMANLVAGRPITVPRQIPVRFPRNTPPGSAQEAANEAAFDLFDQGSRYVVSARVVPHGGLVSLYSPSLDSAGTGSAEPWNREFVRRMFYHLRKPGPQEYLPRRADQENDLFDRIAVSAYAIEPVLRRRGGVLPTFSFPDNDGKRNPVAPDVLLSLERQYPSLFATEFLSSSGADTNPLKLEPYQRFNLLLGRSGNFANQAREFSAWANAQSLDPKQIFMPDQRNPEPYFTYDRRHLLTTVSYSDDLARPQAARSDPLNASMSDPFGLYVGQTKFELSAIATGQSESTPRGAADAFVLQGGAWLYNVDPSSTPVRGPGPRLVRRLADYYYEMLNGYNDFDPASDLSLGAVTRREQSLMLAVNTVAFATPRASNGLTDVVYYDDQENNSQGTGGGLITKRYIGYGPQPFITQVLVYDDDGTDDDELAVGVELYNPNDPTATDYDLQALNLEQFALSISGDPNDAFGGGQTWVRLTQPVYVNQTTPGRMPGRSFMVVGLDDGSNSFFATNGGLIGGGSAVHGSVVLAPGSINVIGDGTSDRVIVRLWKQSLNPNGPRWFLVDRAEIDVTGRPSDDDNPQTWYATYHRDTTAESYFGNYGLFGGQIRPARWRMVTAFEPNDVEYRPATQNFGDGTPPLGELATLGIASSNGSGERTGPTTPMYTMNAPAGAYIWRNTQGAALNRRPNSFPTVGFLHFVPRWSHVEESVDGGVTWPGRAPMGKVMRDQWMRYEFTLGSGGERPVPADFGHMPLFFNKDRNNSDRTVRDGSYFRMRDPAATTDTNVYGAGQIPWGLLVYDYFTTLNYDDPNHDGDTTDALDPLRIPARIDINSAPWFVLAGLPMLNPEWIGNTFANNAATAPSPAFWNPDAGVLVGAPANLAVGYSRFELDARQATIDVANPDAPRLGANLALAAAAYRDRVAYVPSGLLGNYVTLASDAEKRGTGAPYRPGSYGEIRNFVNESEASGGLHYGFLSVGELLNVRGFDQRFVMDNRVDTTSNDPSQRRVFSGTSSSLPAEPPLEAGDFIKAVSLLALLDAQYLTTRSNTFTVYVTVTDREKPQSSVRSQITVDRSNVLPRLTWVTQGGQQVPVVVKSDALPEIIAERQVGYFNARHDD